MKQATAIEDAPALEPKDIFDVEALYREHVLSTPRETEARQGYFHPSAIGACARRNVYEFTRADVGGGHEFEDQETYDMGHAVHDIVQTKLEKAAPMMRARGWAYTFIREIPFDKTTDLLFLDYGLGGTTDGVLEVTSPDGVSQRILVEIKSINQDNFDKLKAAKPDHIEQAMIYAKRFDCPIICVLYYNKNKSKMKVYYYAFSQDVLNFVLERVSGWLQHVFAGTLPDREEDWYMCPRCEYREICEPTIIKKKTKAQGLKTLQNRKSKWAST